MLVKKARTIAPRTGFRVTRQVQRPGGSAELELVDEIARGSEAALSALYDRYCKLLYSQILATLNEPPYG